MQMRGDAGELRDSYQIAARLGAWSLDSAQVELGPISVRVSAVILDRNDFWLSSGDQLDLHLVVGGNRWCWSVDRFHVVEGRTMEVRMKGTPSVLTGRS